ncbi:hypothetical protein BBJ28_00003682 [Nothophytophthora sp. Chile5]|nr:hypothetical protein BBJ28_00003682 [Nothophytophthora sp. Chile5]
MATSNNSSDFQRVKNLWQTRVIRALSNESRPEPPAPVVSSSAETPEPEEGDGYRPSVTGGKTDEPESPKTPELDDDYYSMAHESELPKQRELTEDNTPASPASSTSTSTSTTSPSASPSKPPLNAVTSMFKSLSESHIFGNGSGSGSGAHGGSSMFGGGPSAAADCNSKHQTASSLSLASLPVPTIPDMSSWREKMKFSYGGGRSKAPSTAPSSSSSLLSFATISSWKGTRSASDSDSVCPPSSSTSTSAFSFASIVSTSTLSPREAVKNAVNNVHLVCPRCRTAATNATTRGITHGSPYGELIIVDILSARDLAMDKAVDGVELPVVVAMQLDLVRRQTAEADRMSPTFNERFVFWVPSSPSIDQRALDFSVRGSDDRDLGELHISLAMPVNEAFTDWYPLVSRVDGLKHGALHLGVRRLVLASSPLLQAGQTLAERQSGLTMADREVYGALLPELWRGFPSAEPEAASPKEEALTSKLNDLSRRLIGVDLTLEVGSPVIQRDVF